MLGDRPHPFLFVHIPKTGGTSLEEALMREVTGRASLAELDQDELTRFGLHGGRRSGPPGQRGEVMSPVIQHESVRYFERQGLLAGREVVTVVRNPYERALSELLYLIKIDAKAREFFCGPSWADDLKRLARFAGLLGHDLGASQIDWLTDKSGRMRADRVMYFERLEEEFEALCVDWGITATLPHSMSGGRRFPWWQYYDEEALELMGEKYARDFGAFDYPQGVPDEKNSPAGPTVVDLAHESGFGLHRRLEVPDGALSEIRADGVWEMLDPATAARVAMECRRTLKPSGVLKVVTPDLGAMAGLDERDEFVRNYLDQHVPEAPLYAPAMVVNHWMRSCAFVYDEALLVETLAEGGFERIRKEEGFGWLVVEAERGA